MSADATPATPGSPLEPHERQAISLFRRDIVGRALKESFAKLDPRVQIRNPVMFVVEIGALITTVTWFIQVFGGKPLWGRARAGLVHVRDLVLAVVDGCLRQPRRGICRGSWPGAGGHASRHAPGDRGEAA